MPILDKVSVKDVVYDLSVATDKTLGVENKPADSKAVGDELTDLKADFSELGLSVVNGALCVTYNV